MARILLVEDEKDMAAGLKDNFEFDGHEVLIAEDGERGLHMALNEHPDLILLDLMLPKMSGLDVCRQVREKGKHVPIIMLTARGQEMDKVLGLELGADDYITKPFGLRELLARVHAVLRRYQNSSSKDNTCTVGRLALDFQHYTARDEQGEVTLTHKEFLILQFLYQHRGETVSRDNLLNQVWGDDVYPTTRTVDNQIVKLRKKVEINPAKPKHILTLHGVGYKLCV